MALAMARPFKDPKTGVWLLRQRTPRDLLPLVKGQTVTLPIGDRFATVKIGDMVQASLGTKDLKKAKELHAVADAALRRFWDSQRNGPTQLSQKQAVALAGTLYSALSDAIEDNPGSPETWAFVQDVNDRARQGEIGLSSLKIGKKARVSGSMEERFGELTDALLAREGLTIDADSRALLLKTVADATDFAARKLERNALSDYSPDPAASRFPAWEPPKPAAEKAPATAVLTVAELHERWETYHRDKKAANTLKRYGASLRSLAAFTKEKDVRSLTGDDLFAWAEHRRDRENVSARAVNKNDLVAASSMFSWAVSRQGGRLMSINPAKGIHLDEPRVVPTRERTFRAAEVSAILRAALAATPDPGNPTFSFAKRWCPWLAAYSGARISELTYLNAEDVRDEGGTLVMQLWKTKTGSPRTVPIHEDVIDQGFLEFVKSRKSGPLFYDPKRHRKGSKTHPAEVRAQQVAKWVRKAVNLDMSVDPMHGWRHTWKTTALGVGIPERVSDAITGHRVRSVARGYESPPISMLAEAMQRFPRYPR